MMMMKTTPSPPAPAPPPASVLKQRLPHVPDLPGVYLLKGHDQKVLYIGKAKALQSRLRSYASGTDTRPFVALLDRLVGDVEVVLTHSDKEAMLLENELIKKHRPRFNVKLTDDKRFLCLRLDVKKTYPRLEVVRRTAQDGAKYFGPYHSATAIRESLRLINRHFQLRTCTDQVLKQRTKPCLQYQIKRCPAPCVFDLTGGPYQDNVTAVIAFLQGNSEALAETLERRMQTLAAAEDFEGAALVRDQMRAIARSLERQRMVSHDNEDRDIVGLYREGPAVELALLKIRRGRMVDAARFSLADHELPDEELLGDFLGRYYMAHTNDWPSEILLPIELIWPESLEAWLLATAGHKICLKAPQRGDKNALVRLANRNAAQAFTDRQRQAGAARTAVDRLQKTLHLKRRPSRLECFDISHLQGSHIVASAVCLVEGVPDKALYRHYKIRSTQTQDDFQSMYEVVSRRLRRGLEEDNLPDLIVIDGGKGQLSAAQAAFKDCGVVVGREVELLSLAKARSLPTSPQMKGSANSTPSSQAPSYSPERVFVGGHKDAIVLKQTSAELFLLTRARDEAHRFAITFHRQLRRQALRQSQLDGIAGVGPKRRQKLLRHFGSLQAVRQATLEALTEVVGAQVAAKIFAALHPDPPDPQST